MKQLVFLLLFGLCITHSSKAQVKIGDNPQNIDAASVLELESTDKVLVITRVTTAQMNAITPLQGALVYNTNVQSVHYYDGLQWVNIGGGGGGGLLTADPIVNDISTIVITPTGTGDNLEVAENSIGTLQIANGGINGTEDIQDNSIGPGKIQNQSVTQEKLSENSVGAFALDNDNIGVSAFNNDVGYITSANIVSTDGGNALQIGVDNGAFYDELPLINAIQDNTDVIALDDDQSQVNEIQNLGQVLATGTNGGASLIKNILDPVDPQDAATRAYVDAAITSGGLLANGTILIGDASNAAQQLSIAGDATLAPNGFLTVATDAITTGKISNATILAEDLNQMGAGNGQVLKWNNASGAWIPAADDTGTATALFNPATISGTGVTGDEYTVADDAISTVKILNANVTDAKLAPGGADQVLRTANDGLSVTWVDLPTGAAAITDATIDGDGSSPATALGLADDAVTVDKIAPGTGNQILRTAADGLSVAWVPLPTGAAAITDATIDGDGSSPATALGLADNAVTTDKIAPNGATADGEILQWNTALNTGTGGWEVGANPGHTGDPKSLFYAGADGKPAQFFHPGTGRPSLYWDYEGRTLSGVSYGALAIGIDGPDNQGITPTLSNEVKVHIGESLSNRVSYSLLLQNFWDSSGPSTGSGVGMLFASDRFSDGKGALIFERRDDWGVGDFHFLQNNVGARQAPQLATDKAFTITKDKDIRLYRGIDIDGVGFGTAGQVLASGGTGNQLQWVAAGGADGSETIIDATASTVGVTGNGTTATPYVLTAAGITLAGDVIGSVGASIIAPDAVDSGKIVDLSVRNADIEGGAITTDKIANATILAEDLSDMGAGNNEVLKWNGAAWAPAADAGGDGSETIIDALASTVGVTGNGTIATPYILTAAAAQVSFAAIGNTVSTDVQNAIVELQTEIDGISSGSQNFSNTNLTLTGQRTHSLAGNNLIFGGSGSMAIGTLPGAPQSKLDVDGQIQARNGFASSNGSEGNPAYGFDFDTSVGMYLIGADILGFSTSAAEAMRIIPNGNVGIGTNNPLRKLHIGGDLQVDTEIWIGANQVIPDYVFQKYFLGNSDLDENYDFQTLEEVETFVRKHHHLPGITSAIQAEKEGSWNLSKSNMQNLEKIEELFLHTISQEHKIKNLEAKNETLSEELKAMQKDLEEIKALLQHK